MQPLPLSSFAKALKPLLAAPYDPASDPLISSVANNSSKVTPGTLFLAIRGAKTDGHRFLPDAVRKGASALVVATDFDAPLPSGIPVLRVTDSYFAWAIVCETFFRRPSDSFHVHTVTGTNGKTSTAYFMRHYLDTVKSGAKTALVSTVCCDLGAGSGVSETTGVGSGASRRSDPIVRNPSAAASSSAAIRSTTIQTNPFCFI